MKPKIIEEKLPSFFPDLFGKSFRRGLLQKHFCGVIN
jgi:hypothetical protein